jgi:DNA polymerase I-like protein with 3'-5' exonuclease and polymerase domains
MRYGFVADGFLNHNTGRLSSQNPSMHTIPYR